MDKRFEKRLELAANPRMRKRHGKKPRKFVRAKSHVAAVVGEILDGATSGGGRIYHPNPYVMARDAIDAAAAPVVAVHHLAIAAAMDGVEAVKKRMGKKERMAKLEKRRKYYAAAAERREEMREQIRAARPKPLNPCPTPEALVAAYHRRREGDEWKVFGELMIDLEEHVRREYEISGNKFTGSAGGVKEWLKANCPLLAAHYSTSQHYKRLAQDYHTQVNG